VLREPRTYEAIDPGIFGRDRVVMIGHRLTGRRALAYRAAALGLELSEQALRTTTARVKALADEAPLTQAQIDGLLLEHAAPSGSAAQA
jgi:homocitrate synthase